MIIELLVTPIFELILFIISLIPDFTLNNDSLFNFEIALFISFLGYGFFLFPLQLFMIFTANVVLWKVFQLGWAIIEWAYRKVPGVN